MKYLNNAKYIFDSTLYKFRNPFKAGNLWEFPLHIVDSYPFYKNSHWQNQTLRQVEDETKKDRIAYKKKGNKIFYTIISLQKF